MEGLSLSEHEVVLIQDVLRRHPRVEKAILFGSRAKGTAAPASDVDLALTGLDDPLEAESIASELDELPLPYTFDVKALADIRHPPLLAHIQRVGIVLYQRDLSWQVAEKHSDKHASGDNP